jgi:hypothetical protein
MNLFSNVIQFLYNRTLFASSSALRVVSVAFYDFQLQGHEATLACRTVNEKLYNNMACRPAAKQ